MINCITEFIKFNFFVVCTTYNDVHCPNQMASFLDTHALIKINNQKHSESKEYMGKCCLVLFVFKN